MPEKREPVRTIRVVYICDECGDGEMKAVPRVAYTSLSGQPYRCPSCGYEQKIRGVRYPRIEYEEATTS